MNQIPLIPITSLDEIPNGVEGQVLIVQFKESLYPFYLFFWGHRGWEDSESDGFGEYSPDAAIAYAIITPNPVTP